MSRIMVARAHVPLTKRGFAVEGRCVNTDRASWEPRSMKQLDLAAFERADEYPCDECGRGFGSSRALNIHRHRVHDTDGEHPWRDRETLHRLYHGEKMSMKEVADELDCDAQTVCDWLEKLDVGSRSQDETRAIRGTHNGNPKEGPHHDPEWLEERYVEDGRSLAEMGELADVAPMTIQRAMDRHGIDRRSPTHHLEKETTIRTGKRTAHERISFTVDGQTHYYDVHRLLAIAVFGLEAVAGKIVHHINGLSWDNRPGNFELIESQAEHARRHAEDRERDELGRFT